VSDPFQRVLYVAFYSQGIFKSTDLTGDQWKMLTQGLPAAPTDKFGWISLAFGGRTGIGFSEPLPLLYAGYALAGDTFGLFKTVNGGDSWMQLPSPPSEYQIGFNDVVGVGSYDSNEVYVGQVTLWRAFDGGAKGGVNDYRAITNPHVTDNSWDPISCCLDNPWRFGMDLHGDNHDIEFAPYGSFLPSVDAIEMVYVANDGGLAKGNINSDRVVNWQSLTKGLAISQIGTIALDPGNPFNTASGAWHNGDVITRSDIGDSVAIIGGDGYQVAFDAGSPIVYVDCNAGYDGSICRTFPISPGSTNFTSERIWDVKSGTAHWADPHRPGHLLRLDPTPGLLFRTTVADTATAAVLKSPDAWEAVDPFWGKTGKTTTMAFRSRVLEETPVYYLGTDTGQVWRGSPEAGWVKLCECGSGVNAIAPDLFQNERIFVVLNGATSPGRIKQISLSANGTWAASDIDANFKPDLRVDAVTSVMVDPNVQGINGTTIYVGTDQGLYRGHLDARLVLDPTVSARVVHPPSSQDWTWRRSPGVPNVLVMDLKVHQNFQGRDRSGIVRAGTYGRGIYQLNEAGPKLAPTDTGPLILNVRAMRIGEEGLPLPVAATVGVSLKSEKANRQTPFEFRAAPGAEVVLQAPREIRQADAVLSFLGWAVPAKKAGKGETITVALNAATTAIAYYEKKSAVPDGKAKPLHVSVAAKVQQVCQRSFSHELTVSWEVTEGQRPVAVQAEITYPDKHVENLQLKPIAGSRPLPVNYPGGGELTVKLIAEDVSKQSASADSAVTLKPCKK
jgi:hypothetical protein